MTSERLARRRWRMMIWLMATVISVAVIALLEPKLGFALVGVPFAAALITFGVAAFRSSLGQKLQRARFVVGVLVSALAYLIIVVLALTVTFWPVASFFHGASPFSDFGIEMLTSLLKSRIFFIGVLFAFVFALGFSFVSGVRRKLGPGVLANWMLGRYHRPREEERLFMFIDLTRSVGLAEQMDNLRFSALLQDFFAEITPAIVEYGGEISHYVGDAVIVTWRLPKGLDKGRCLACYKMAKQLIEAKALAFAAEYGVVPDFKASIHGGSAVMTEVGVIKTQIVFHGDVLNTTERILSLCGPLNVSLLLSKEVAEGLPADVQLGLVDLGEHQVRGREQAVHVFGLAEAKQTLPAKQTRARARA